MESHLKNLGQVKRVTVGFLSDLLTAAEAVGKDEPVGWSVADRRQEFEFADGDRDIIFVVFEPERPGHAAATGGRGLIVESHPTQDGLLGAHLQDRLVMAVSVNQRFAFEARKGDKVFVIVEELAQEEGLPREALSALVVGEEVAEFVAEDRHATGLEADDGDAGFDFDGKGVENL